MDNERLDSKCKLCQRVTVSHGVLDAHRLCMLGVDNVRVVHAMQQAVRKQAHFVAKLALQLSKGNVACCCDCVYTKATKAMANDVPKTGNFAQADAGELWVRGEAVRTMGKREEMKKRRGVKKERKR